MYQGDQIVIEISKIPWKVRSRRGILEYFVMVYE